MPDGSPFRLGLLFRPRMLVSWIATFVYCHMNKLVNFFLRCTFLESDLGDVSSTPQGALGSSLPTLYMVGILAILEVEIALKNAFDREMVAEVY